MQYLNGVLHSSEAPSYATVRNILQEFCKAKEECRLLQELNTKLESELKESRESEKSHRYHVQNSREMIGNLQETVSQLVYLKRDVKKLKEEVSAKDAFVGVLQQVWCPMLN